MLPAWLVEAQVAAGSARRLVDGWSLPQVTAIAIHRAELRSAARVRAFLEHVRRAPTSTGRSRGAGAKRG